MLRHLAPAPAPEDPEQRAFDHASAARALRADRWLLWSLNAVGPAVAFFACGEPDAGKRVLFWVLAPMVAACAWLYSRASFDAHERRAPGAPIELSARAAAFLGFVGTAVLLVLSVAR